VKETDPEKMKSWTKWPLRIHLKFVQGLERVTVWYQGILEKALNRRKRVIFGVVGVAVLSLCLLPLIGTEFIPNMDSGQIDITFKEPIGTRLERTDQVLNKLQTIVAEKVPENQENFGRVGVDGRGMGSLASAFGGVSGSHGGTMQMQLVKKNKRKRSTDEIVELLRVESAKIPGADIKVRGQSGMGGLGGSAPIRTLPLRFPDFPRSRARAFRNNRESIAGPRL
jgi:HAE1 family hydrophobic/amphiphilic exporter-1